MGLSSRHTQSTRGCVRGVWPQSPHEQMEPRAMAVHSVRSALARPPTPACTYTLPLPALIPSGAERVPGSFGPLPQASQRLLCLHHRVRSCQGSLKAPPAGFGPGALRGGCCGTGEHRAGPTCRVCLLSAQLRGCLQPSCPSAALLCRPLGLWWGAVDNLARAEERVRNREQPPGNGRHAIPCRLAATLTQVSPCPCPPGAVLHIGVLRVISTELPGPAASEPLCQTELGVRNLLRAFLCPAGWSAPWGRGREHLG